MKRLIFLFALAAFVLAACEQASDSNLQADFTPLPTAVPPSEGAGGGSLNLPFAAQIPVNHLVEGDHRYAIWVKCPLEGLENMSSGWIRLIVSESFTQLETNVFLRLGGISTDPLAPPNLPGFHPQQEGVQALVTLLGLTEETLDTAINECDMVILFNDGIPATLQLHPLDPFEG